MQSTPLSTEEINELCLQFLETTTKAHPRYYPLFDMLFRTGMRFEDCYSLSRWAIVSPQVVTVQTAKGSDIRTFTESDINPYLWAAIHAQNFSYFNFSYSTIRRYFSLAFPIPNLTVLSKPIKTHIFRHNKARMLKASGLSDLEIKAYLGERSLSSAKSYIYSNIVPSTKSSPY